MAVARPAVMNSRRFSMKTPTSSLLLILRCDQLRDRAIDAIRHVDIALGVHRHVARLAKSTEPFPGSDSGRAEHDQLQAEGVNQEDAGRAAGEVQAYR